MPRKQNRARVGRKMIARTRKAIPPPSATRKGWTLAITGVMLMQIVTPAVVINHPETIPPLLITEQLTAIKEEAPVRPESKRITKNYCLPGEQYGGHFNIADHVKSKAISLRYAEYTLTMPAKVIPKPRRKPNWLENVARTTVIETEKFIEATRKAGKKIYSDITRRTVTGNGQRMVLEPKTARLFVELERRWGQRLEVRWAYRDPRLNKKVGGAGKSMHIKKQAIDIVHGGWSKARMRSFVRLAYRLGFRGFGMGRNVIHLDTRPNLTSWNYGGNVYGLAYSMVK